MASPRVPDGSGDSSRSPERGGSSQARRDGPLGCGLARLVHSSSSKL